MKWLVACAMLASPAQGYCPVADDLATGIIVAAQEHVMTFTAVEPEVVLIALENRLDEQSYTATLWHGILTQQMHSSFSEGGEVTSTLDSYDPQILAALWPMRTGISVTGDYLRTDQDTGGIQPLVLRIQTSAQPAIVIGGCTYDAIRLERTYVVGTLEFTHRDLYLPDLGFAINVAYQDPEQLTEYPLVSITSVAAQND